MIDVQSQPDTRNIKISQVGICDLKYPITVLDKASGVQHTVATVGISSSLAPNLKGTHMSRFTEILNSHKNNISVEAIPEILKELKLSLMSDYVRVELMFPYFIEKVAPISKATGLMQYECRLIGEITPNGSETTLEVTVPVTTLCPCSKALSRNGAHNQRGYIDIRVKLVEDSCSTEKILWVEDLVTLAETSASSPVYPILKRVDEQYVTEEAYDNPVFVEDIVRNVAVGLNLDTRVGRYQVVATNHESIHNHNAFAMVERGAEV